MSELSDFLQPILSTLTGFPLPSMDNLRLINVDKSININDPTFNISISVRERSLDRSASPALSAQAPPTLIMDVRRSPVADDSHAESAVQITQQELPFTSGIYLRFSDPDWWNQAPDHIDVAPNLRFLSLKNRTNTFPSIEAGMRRSIEVTRYEDALVVKRPFDAMEFSVPLDPEPPTSRTVNRCRSWSLEHIVDGTTTKLRLKDWSVVLEYERRFAPSMWCLVNDHETRGEETYIITYKK